METNQSTGKTMVGRVISDKMTKTIVVMVERSVKHPKYGKILNKRTKIYAHDEDGVCKVGDLVRVRESRPISKTKCWVLMEKIA